MDITLLSEPPAGYDWGIETRPVRGGEVEAYLVLRPCDAEGLLFREGPFTTEAGLAIGSFEMATQVNNYLRLEQEG